MSRLPVPSKLALHREARALRERRIPEDSWDFFASATMDELIHSGRADLAWDFFDEAWPPGKAGKAAARHDVRARLRSSPWFADLQRMQGMAHQPALHTEAFVPLFTGCGR